MSTKMGMPFDLGVRVSLSTNILVVVDMQPIFSAARNAVVQKNCKRLIKMAKGRGDFIILLEYENCGNTLKPISSLVEGYLNCLTVSKDRCGGGFHIEKELKLKNISPLTFTVCGVNSDMCVRETAYEISNIYPDSKVLVKRIACGTCSYDFKWVNFYIPSDNVKVV